MTFVDNVVALKLKIFLCLILVFDAQAYLPALHASTRHHQWFSQHRQDLSRDLFSPLYVNQAPQLSNSLGTWPYNFHSYDQPEYVFAQRTYSTSPMQPRNLFSPVTQESRQFRRNKKFISHYAKSNKLTENIAIETETIDDEENEDAETSPNLIEGDIAVDMDVDSRSRLAIDFLRHPAKKWPNNTVPYRISANYTPSEELTILSAMRTISFVSCIKFVKWDGKRKDYIHFHPDKKRLGCWSYIGRQNKRQQLSLQQPNEKDCNCFCSPGRAMHEIMHALGFYHEHARADRDKYIKIIKKNVRKGKDGNFDFQNDDDSSRNFNYDYNSIMHYGPYYFSKNKRRRKATIVPLKPGVSIGQRDMLSKTDCMKLNSQYNCFPSNMEQMRKIQIICGMVGV